MFKWRALQQSINRSLSPPTPLRCEVVTTVGKLHPFTHLSALHAFFPRVYIYTTYSSLFLSQPITVLLFPLPYAPISSPILFPALVVFLSRPFYPYRLLPNSSHNSRFSFTLTCLFFPSRYIAFPLPLISQHHPSPVLICYLLLLLSTHPRYTT